MISLIICNILTNRLRDSGIEIRALIMSSVRSKLNLPRLCQRKPQSTRRTHVPDMIMVSLVITVQI